MTSGDPSRRVRDEHTGLELRVPSDFTLLDTPIAAVCAVGRGAPDARVRPVIVATVGEAHSDDADALTWARKETSLFQQTTPGTIVMDVAVRSGAPHRLVEVVTSTTDGAVTFIAVTEFRVIDRLRVRVDVVGSPWDLPALWHLSRAVSESVIAPTRPSPASEPQGQLGQVRSLIANAVMEGR